MKRTRLSQIVFSCVAATAMFVGSVASAAPDSHTEKVIASFLEHVAGLDSIDDQQKSDIQNSVQQLAEDSNDAVTDGLMKIYPKYASAVESSDDQNVDEAIKQLSPLADAEDQFLAADASFYLARTLMNNERYEEAIPRLEKLTGDQGKFTVHQGSAQYFTGVAQAGLLQNQEAIASLMQFLSFNPDAPERLRVSAWRQIQQLQSIETGKLDDVQQRMDFSRRRLELIETDETTQDQQDKIVTMLTKLIKEAEKKECSSNCKKGECKNPSDSQKPQQAESKPKDSKSQKGGSSNNANGKVVDKSFDDSPASPWSRLRDRARDPANNAVKEKLPARYRDIVEKYIEAVNGDQKK